VQLYEAVLIPFEISALNLVLTFWRDDIPVAAVVAGCIVLYGIINLFAVRAYGESEFWLYVLWPPELLSLADLIKRIWQDNTHLHVVLLHIRYDGTQDVRLVTSQHR
jgi:hypothetical protein